MTMNSSPPSRPTKSRTLRDAPRKRLATTSSTASPMASVGVVDATGDVEFGYAGQRLGEHVVIVATGNSSQADRFDSNQRPSGYEPARGCFHW
jgi:hypothetical protein